MMGILPSALHSYSIVAVAFYICLVTWIVIWLKRSTDSARRRYETIASIILLAIGGVPLLIYPLVLIVSPMAFDSLGTWGPGSGIISVSLLVTTILAYPLTYFLCLWRIKTSKRKILTSLLPLIHLAAIPSIGLIMSAVEETRQDVCSNATIYRNTPAWGLARAVRDQDPQRIAEIAKSDPKLLECHDPVFGTTLLIWAVGTDRYKAATALLKAGANPDATTLKRGLLASRGETALHVAAGISYDGTVQDPKYVKLLLKYGANPNIGLVSGNDHVGTEAGMTPLIRSVGFGFEKTKALVEAGANINVRTRTGMTAAIEALDSTADGNREYAHYLIAEKHAGVTKPWFPKPNYPSDPQESIEPVELLRQWTPDLGSEDYRVKMDIVKEFARQGVDYRKTKIPKNVVEWAKKEYPDTWQEYIKKY